MTKSFKDMFELKNVLEKTSCFEHRVNPKITVSGSLIILECCCPQFHGELSSLALEINEVLHIKNITIK